MPRLGSLGVPDLLLPIRRLPEASDSRLPRTSEAWLRGRSARPAASSEGGRVLFASLRKNKQTSLMLEGPLNFPKSKVDQVQGFDSNDRHLRLPLKRHASETLPNF